MTSKAKSHPCREVIHIFAGRTLLQEFSSEEVGIDRAGGDVARDVPLQHGLSLAANVAGGTPVAGTNKLEGVVVNAVARAFAPEEITIADKRKVAGQLEF